MKIRREDRIWVSRIVESRFPFRIRSPLLSGVMKLGTIPILVSVWFVASRGEHMAYGALVSLTCALLWVCSAPYLIWYYDERLLPAFFRNAEGLVEEVASLRSLSGKYDRLFGGGVWYATVPWTVALVVAWGMFGHRYASGGILGTSDPWYWLGFVAVAWVGLLTSAGFWGVVTCIMAIVAISRGRLRLDPFHPDRLGGLASVGEFAIGTTLLFSSGTFFLPGAFHVASEVAAGRTVAIAFVVLFSGFILLSFAYPTLQIHAKAKAARYGMLYQIKCEIGELLPQLNRQELKHDERMVLYLELSRLRERYQDFWNVRVYPFETDVGIKLITSVVLPFLFLIIQTRWLE